MHSAELLLKREILHSAELLLKRAAFHSVGKEYGGLHEKDVFSAIS